MADPALAFNALPPDEQQAFLNGPGLEPPANVIPNFDNRPNQSGIAHATFATCIVVSSIFIVLAIYAKAAHFKKVYIEDVCAAIAIIGWIALLVYVYRALIQYGFFVHQWDLRMYEVSEFFFLIYVATICYFIVMSTIKAAIVLEWTRLFVPLGRRTKFFWTCHAVAWTNFVASVTMMFLVAFACNPREKYWNPLVEGKCLDANATAFAAPIVNLLFDIIALVLPQKVIWSLHLPLKKKLGISVLFALGILACVSAALRIGYSVTFYTDLDRSYNNGPVALWCLAEATSGILIYCAPAAPKAISGVKRGVKSSASRLTGHSGVTASKDSSGGASWHAAAVKSPRPGRYQEIDELPLTTLPAATSVTGGDLGSGLSQHHDGSGIMRTTTTIVKYKPSNAGNETPRWESQPGQAI
ncbi:hypothetical protein DL764_002273 [Monosporascus ibericus]|uniref:Rhodopsin domain-containing protein n=1 Tax=Monosporascus ibericus TaxID=155417 RepID=A0A4Q4TMC8_9PEZI|nr:hypothetical protein DL764_002273 [Monosporascus ibericus]